MFPQAEMRRHDMYLHLGQSVVVPDEDIVGVFDLDITSQAYLTREFLNRSEKEGRVVNVSEEIPKSFVVCDSRKKGKKVYISQLASTTLQRRTILSLERESRQREL
jgi:hypothetical protein